jgi:uncharacterized protein
MALFIFIGFDRRKDGEAIRAATRPAHLEYTQKHGQVKFGGPVVGNKGEMIGSISIVEAENYDAALKYVQNDPYNHADLFERQELHPWQPRINTFEKM